MSWCIMSNTCYKTDTPEVHLGNVRRLYCEEHGMPEPCMDGPSMDLWIEVLYFLGWSTYDETAARANLHNLEIHYSEFIDDMYLEFLGTVAPTGYSMDDFYRNEDVMFATITPNEVLVITLRK